MLERQGMMVAAVESAEAGLVEAEQHRFDILISDVVLPGRSGPELAREVRQRWPGTRVLFISGYTGDLCSPGDLDSPLGFLQKPFSGQELVDRIHAILTRTGAS
jgi:DNA-binding response OmpR family regulator